MKVFNFHVMKAVSILETFVQQSRTRDSYLCHFSSSVRMKEP